MVHVPYRSTPDLDGDLMTDRIQAVFAPLASTMPTLRTGKALALAVTSRKGIQSPMVLPTVSDEAISGYEYSQWFGFIAHAAVPAPILEQLARAIQAVGEEKDMREKLEAQGVQPRFLLLRDFDAFIKTDVEKLGQITKGAGITAN
jgi:tripartite-type tricarboxylate transporter receptor subunit TctC